jgi:hyperosmotically inducible periplasmic protein
MKKAILMSMLSLIAMGCEQHDKKVNVAPHSNNADSARSYEADNTGKNVRDRDHTLTPGDQSEDEGDLTITKNIRQALMADDTLSTNAKNVKIITVKRVVTLRGPVGSAQEKANIERKAGQAAGVEKINSFLEVAAKNP